MVHLHSILRWAVLILALITVFKSYTAMSAKRNFTASDKKLSLFFLISMDLQLVIGLVLYFTSAWGIKNIESMGGMGAVMKDKAARFFIMEHTVGMLLAIIFAHIAYSAAKKATADSSKSKKVFIFSMLSLIVMLASIPWPFREAIRRSLFPGM